MISPSSGLLLYAMRIFMDCVALAALADPLRLPAAQDAYFTWKQYINCFLALLEKSYRRPKNPESLEKLPFYVHVFPCSSSPAAQTSRGSRSNFGLVTDTIWGLYRDSVKIPRSTVICCPWGYVCDRSRFFLFFRNLFFLFSGQRAVFPLKPFQFFRSDKPLRHLSVCVYMINHTSQRIGCGRLVTVPH